MPRARIATHRCIVLTLLVTSAPWLAGAAEAAVRLDKVEVSKNDATTEVHLRHWKGKPPNFFQLAEPDRLVVDLPQVELSPELARNDGLPKAGLVSGLRFERIPEKKTSGWQLVIDVSTPVRSDVRIAGDDLVIALVPSTSPSNRRSITSQGPFGYMSAVTPRAPSAAQALTELRSKCPTMATRMPAESLSLAPPDAVVGTYFSAGSTWPSEWMARVNLQTCEWLAFENFGDGSRVSLRIEPPERKPVWSETSWLEGRLIIPKDLQRSPDYLPLMFVEEGDPRYALMRLARSYPKDADLVDVELPQVEQHPCVVFARCSDSPERCGTGTLFMNATLEPLEGVAPFVGYRVVEHTVQEPSWRSFNYGSARDDDVDVSSVAYVLRDPKTNTSRLFWSTGATFEWIQPGRFLIEESVGSRRLGSWRIYSLLDWERRKKFVIRDDVGMEGGQEYPIRVPGGFLLMHPEEVGGGTVSGELYRYDDVVAAKDRPEGRVLDAKEADAMALKVESVEYYVRQFVADYGDEDERAARMRRVARLLERASDSTACAAKYAVVRWHSLGGRSAGDGVRQWSEVRPGSSAGYTDPTFRPYLVLKERKGKSLILGPFPETKAPVDWSSLGKERVLAHWVPMRALVMWPAAKRLRALAVEVGADWNVETHPYDIHGAIQWRLNADRVPFGEGPVKQADAKVAADRRICSLRKKILEKYSEDELSFVLAEACIEWFGRANDGWDSSNPAVDCHDVVLTPVCAE